MKRLTVPSRRRRSLAQLVPPGRIPNDQAWFWTPEWQAMEREAEVDIAEDRISGPFETAEELIGHLRSIERAVD